MAGACCIAAPACHVLIHYGAGMNDVALPDPDISAWYPPAMPGPDIIEGRYVRLERLDPERHAPDVFVVTSVDETVWDYMSNGPFADASALSDWMGATTSQQLIPYAFVNAATGRAFGYAAFMRIDAANGVLEIGHVMIGSAAQRSRAASEALMVMISWAFGAGYRRVEWKCNLDNVRSRRAARRYGFVFEGVFRQHLIIKSRNRDTAWFAMLDRDWPDVSRAYAYWLDPGNFDAAGKQHARLSELTAPCVRQAEIRLAELCSD
ncbi:MAG: GNAT family N-acetyltransferase [Paracoccus sp. (in: a-proteobacteria)]